MRFVRMLKDQNGSNHGFDVKAFLSDKEYEVGPEISESLAFTFVEEMKVGEYVDTRSAPAGEGDQGAESADAPLSNGDAPAEKTNAVVTDDAAAAAADAAAKEQAAKTSKAVSKKGDKAS